ncbi:MAG: helix-turn-helix domain-containing protein [Bacteroidetes bacterium]|nr:helix-turn-helix domain-containing protein [Bacteroidota bacterium]
MEDILLSKQQYEALLSRLEKINNRLITLNPAAQEKPGYLCKDEMQKLLLISSRTAQRWRSMGRLPYTKIGQKIYYKVDDLLERIKIRSTPPNTPEQPPPFEFYCEDQVVEIKCKECPLFILFNS